MMMRVQDPQVRDCIASDIAAIHRIYANEVLHGLATFEEVPPAPEEMARRWREIIAAGYPFIVATLGEKIVGYGYLSTYRPRTAYRYCVENTVYVDKAHRGIGVGKALLEAIIVRCEQGGWRQMIAVIGDTGNAGSRALHQSLGFREAGVLHAVGFKLGRWVDSVIMQRPIGNSDKVLPGRSADSHSDNSVLD